jgi:hypothetical protein
VIDLFMKFENAKPQEQILNEIRKQADNPYARLDEGNPWAQIALVVLKTKGENSLQNLKVKIDKFRNLVKLQLQE